MSKATKARDEALDRVDEGTDEEWRRAARKALKRVAKRKKKLTADDIWTIGNLPRTRENRALGPIMLWGKREGIIEDTDRMTRSSQENCHAMPRRIWKSKIYKKKR